MWCVWGDIFTGHESVEGLWHVTGIEAEKLRGDIACVTAGIVGINTGADLTWSSFQGKSESAPHFYDPLKRWKKRLLN